MNLFDYIAANTPRKTRPAVSPAQVIDQGLLGGAVGRIPGNASRLLQRAKAAPAELAALTSPQMRQQFEKVMDAPPSPDKQQWFDAGMELSGVAPVSGLLAHTVYHGSPHKFDKFDMSKIGTGEGAQAYGHGLYFAEAPDVAKSYIPPNTQAQETIAGLLKKETARAQRYSNEGGMEVYEMFQKGYTPSGIRANIDNLIESGEAHPDYIKKMEQAYKKATEIYKANPAGNMYKVDIPDESIPRMLDWDKPLSEQSPYVQAAIRTQMPDTAWDIMKDRTGQDYLSYYLDAGVQNQRGGIQQSAQLNDLGIPGIRYLDGNSRGAGGTSNFVLFDDQLPRILETNGVPAGLLSYADEAAQKKAKK